MTYAHSGQSAIALSERSKLENFICEMMSSPLMSTAVRELIVAEECGFRHSGKRFGPDAYTTSDEPIEIKTESTYSYANGRLKKLSGDGMFPLLTEVNISSQTDKHVVAGFHRGILVYAIEFPFHGDFSCSMEKILKHKSQLTVVKFNNSHWRNLPDLNLVYYSDNCDILKVNHISDVLTSELLAVINRLSYK